MKIGLNIGHYGTVGAEGILSEIKCNTEIYRELVPMLQGAGHEVVSCNVAKSPDYVSSTTFANTQSLDLVISLHCNSHNSNANGTEVMYYKGNSKTKELAEKISKSISTRIGTKNRGSVPRSDLYILTNTKASAVLVEGFFVSNKGDCDKYNAKKIAQGIAEVFGYKESEKGKNKYSYDNTVENLISNGITTIDNMQYWEKVLDGRQAVNIECLRTLLDRYNAKLKGALISPSFLILIYEILSFFFNINVRVLIVNDICFYQRFFWQAFTFGAVRNIPCSQ